MMQLSAASLSSTRSNNPGTPRGRTGARALPPAAGRRRAGGRCGAAGLRREQPRLELDSRRPRPRPSGPRWPPTGLFEAPDNVRRSRRHQAQARAPAPGGPRPRRPPLVHDPGDHARRRRVNSGLSMTKRRRPPRYARQRGGRGSSTTPLPPMVTARRIGADDEAVAAVRTAGASSRMRRITRPAPGSHLGAAPGPGRPRGPASATRPMHFGGALVNPARAPHASAARAPASSSTTTSARRVISAASRTHRVSSARHVGERCAGEIHGDALAGGRRPAERRRAPGARALTPLPDPAAAAGRRLRSVGRRPACR